MFILLTSFYVHTCKTQKRQKFVKNNMEINYEYMLYEYTYNCTIIYVSMCLVLFKYSALKIDQVVQDTDN